MVYPLQPGGGSASTKCCINTCPDGVDQKPYPDCSCYCDEAANPCDAPKEYEEPGVDCGCVCKKTDADCPAAEPTLNSTTCECECNGDPDGCSGATPTWWAATCQCVCIETNCNYPDEVWDSDTCSCVYNTQGYASFMVP